MKTGMFLFKATRQSLCSTMPGTKDEAKGKNGGKAVLIHKSITHNVKHGEMWMCEILVEQKTYVLVKPLNRVEFHKITYVHGKYQYECTSGITAVSVQHDIPADAIEELQRYEFLSDSVIVFTRYKFGEIVSDNKVNESHISPNQFLHKLMMREVDIPQSLIQMFLKKYYRDELRVYEILSQKGILR